MRIGIALPIGERGPDRRATPYRDMRQLALTAEDGGLDSVYAADHFYYKPKDGLPRGLWECWTMLSALAEATERVELGPLVLCTPFRNPGLLAWMATALDEVSAGRLVLGLGSGWHEPEFRSFGYDFDHRVGILADSLAVLVPLLRDGHVEYSGRFATGDAELRPRGPRQGGPPIMIASEGPRMMALTARWADRWNSAWFGRPVQAFRDERDRLHAACAQIGRDPGEIEVNVGIDITDDERGTTGDEKSLTGDAEQLAEAFAAWQREGIAELICRLQPPVPAMVERVARAAEIARS